MRIAGVVNGNTVHFCFDRGIICEFHLFPPNTPEELKNARLVFASLERTPVIEISKTAVSLGLSFNNVSSAVKRLCDAGILKEMTHAARNRTFAYEDYLAILRKGI